MPEEDRVATLLDVPLRPAVQGLDHDRLVSRLHQEDEGDRRLVYPQDRGETEHLVLGRGGDHDLESSRSEERHGLVERPRRCVIERSVARERPRRLLAPGGIAVVVEDGGHGFSCTSSAGEVICMCISSQAPSPACGISAEV
ncbi:MAG: hypothetical protein AB7S61_04385 [Methanoregulaceae archaeon]